jgi:1-acyl-sn-glycerol-3-phosphate acyltransferase
VAIYNQNQFNTFGRLFQAFAVNYFISPYYHILYKIKVNGKENIPNDKKPFIVMPNHLSNFDPPLVSVVFHNIRIAYMAKKELFEVPFLKQLIISLGAFSVDREKIEKTTIKATKEIIKKNWCLCMFLEGTRSKSPGILGKPNAGPAFVANLNNVPILPVGILGSNNPKNGLTVNIGKLFYPDKDAEKAKVQCAEKLCELTGFKMPE